MISGQRWRYAESVGVFKVATTHKRFTTTLQTQQIVCAYMLMPTKWVATVH